MTIALISSMPLQLGWTDVALRLFLTVVAGALLGLNREEHDRPAGLRTMILVCLAASMSMIEVNLLLIVGGKTQSSFAVLDLMRLPLGILSGMGFIGAGAILKKENIVTGVTTAATLWFVTMVGICLGGGQLVFGVSCAALGFLALWALKWIEIHWHRGQRGTLKVVSKEDRISFDEIARHVREGGGHLLRLAELNVDRADGRRETSLEIAWKTCPADPQPPHFLKSLSERGDVLQVEWKI